MLVTITQEDIDQGERRNPHYCPMALALRRITGSYHVRVGYWASVDEVYYKLSERASNWIFDFDWQNTVKPTAFRLTLRD